MFQRIVLVFVLLLAFCAVNADAQIAATSITKAGDVTSYRFMCSAEASSATYTVMIPVSQASAVSIQIASGTQTLSGSIAGNYDVQVQGKLPVSANVTTWAALSPAAIGTATDYIYNYGIYHYDPAALSWMRVYMPGHAAGTSTNIFVNVRKSK